MSRRHQGNLSDARVSARLAVMETQAQTVAEERAQLNVKLAEVEQARKALQAQCDLLTQELQAVRARVAAVERRPA